MEPFTTSILDGIDIRETIRNWHRHKIFVRKADRLAGEVGAVVVIFDEDREDRYTYLTTWLGEHQNESDMAFYSTPPFDNIVGPGIGRAEYGGLLMTLPPRRLFDVWSDPDYEFAESKSERLLMAALDYSVERFVVYVAAKPPRSILRSIASHLGRKILYVPIWASFRRRSSRSCAWCTCSIATSAPGRERIYLVIGHPRRRIFGKCPGALKSGWWSCWPCPAHGVCCGRSVLSRNIRAASTLTFRCRRIGSIQRNGRARACGCPAMAAAFFGAATPELDHRLSALRPASAAGHPPPDAHRYALGGAGCGS